MINSILERHTDSIVIDKLLIPKDNNNIELINDPTKIKAEVVRHFQTCALPPNSREYSMSPRWTNQYQPKDHINDGIYDPLNEPIEMEEWLDTINSLPNNKATGPSTISNEMLKHLSHNGKALLMKIANISLELGDIPGD